MKLLIIFSLLAASSLSAARSIDPSKVVTPFLNIFSSKNVKASETVMKVRVSPYDYSGTVTTSNKTINMPMAEYLKALKQSQAVYKVDVTEDNMNFFGTAFHIGENLVLTNQHVLSPNRANTTQCGSFQIKDGTDKNSYPCKKVHHCDVELDVCLIEMDKQTICHNFLCTKKTYKELKTSESLKLKAKPTFSVETMDTIVLNVIGNTLGLGIHFSQGKGMRIVSERIYFWAPLRKGNSGGPLVGNDGLAWGVAKLESAQTVGSESYNIAAPMNVVIEKMKLHVADQDILAKFNKAIVVQ